MPGALESDVLGAGGVRLRVRRWPAEEVRARLLIVHGYLEHCGRYDELATFLAERGIETAAFDLRGHGLSEGPRAYLERFADYLDDLAAVQATLDGAWFLLGHSLGGLISLRWCQERTPRPRGLILSDPYLVNALRVPGWKLALGRFLGRHAPRAALPAGVKSEALSRDPEKVRAHARDPLIIQSATAGWFREVTAAQVAALAESALDVPLLYLIGDADSIASPQANREYAERLRAPDKTVRVVAGAYHEVLNEVGRADLYAEVADWVLRRA